MSYGINDTPVSYRAITANLMFFISIFTLFTFIISFLTPPLSGPFCQSGCYKYPFIDIASRYPRDYYWMFAAMVLYVVLIPSLVSLFMTMKRSIASLTALIFTVTGTIILLADYFIQVSVIQISLINNETDGISILTQYNSHGLFIVLEELGYMLICLAFLFYSALFKWKGIDRAIKTVFLAGFLLAFISLVIISATMGLAREYIFEIAVISIVWLVLIINGILIGIKFRRNEEFVK